MGATPGFISPFVLPKEAYQRNLNVLEDYVADTALFLSKMKQRPLSETRDFVKRTLGKNGTHPFVDPKITYLEKNEVGDRVMREGTLLRFLKDSIKQREIIAPNLTTYVHPEVNKSWLADIVERNIKKRKKAKNEMFAAEREGNLFLYTLKDLEQTNAKQANNSLSGGHSSTSTPLYMKSAHSTLTSVCRSTSGYGNANNEKFLAGNRHYWSPQIVKTNLISIIGHTDYEKLEAVMTKYQLVYPSVEQVMLAIDRCTKNYWRDSRQERSIMTLVQNCTPLERAAFLYTGDFYNLRQLNPEIVRAFIDRMGQRIPTPLADYEPTLKTVAEDVHILALVLCPEEARGRKPEDIAKDPLASGIIAATIENVHTTITDWADFIDVFFVSVNVPASLAHFPGSIRHTALMSDTDSTIFTVQDWVEWHQGHVHFGPEANAVSDVVVFMAAATITHVLARMSANLGVVTERINQIAMKNEFKFDVFVPTNNTKHYFALISRKEASLYAKFKEEIKGVHLKNSKVQKAIIQFAEELMIEVMKTIVGINKIDLRNVLQRIGDLEREVYSTIARGDADFFQFARINAADSYKAEDKTKTPYNHHLIWEEVFADKYGHMPEPPYVCYKASTELGTPTKTREFIASLEDRALAGRLDAYLKKYNRDKITTLYVPEEIINSNGAPLEILQAINSRKIVTDNCNVFYLILDSLGLTMQEGVLVSDYY